MNSEPALTVIITVAVILGVATLIIMRGRGESAGASDPPAARPAPSFAGAVIIMAVALVLVILLNSAYTAYEIQQTQRQWCDTLNLLTSHQVPKPGDPAANPSREQAYVLYSDFASLRDRFGCG